MSAFPRASEPTQLVIISLEAWDQTWRRNQLIIRDLSALRPDLRILYVEPADDVGLFRRPRDSGLSPVFELGGLWRVRFAKRLPRALGPWADLHLVLQLRSALRSLEFDRPVFWINDLNWAHLLRWRRPTLYDITDDWVEERGIPDRVRRRRLKRERRLLRASGAVVACSHELVQRKLAVRPDIRLIPNAVDRNHFQKPRPRPVDLPPGPIAVYVGTLQDERIDVQLARDVALALPEINFVFVGPNHLSERVLGVLDLPNVHLLGAHPYLDVPAYLQHADVVFIPHLVNAFTTSLDPIKAYECRALGKKVVATPVPGFVELAGCAIAEDAPQAVSAIIAALATPILPLPGDVPTWMQRAEAFSEVIDEVIRRAG